MIKIQNQKIGHLTVGRLLVESSPSDIKNGEDGEKSGNYFIEGIFMQGDCLNNNKRVYPINILDEAVKQFIEQRVDQKTAWGELSHPDTPKINLENAAILVTSLEKQGKDYHGKAKVCHEDCPKGKILRGLIKTGGRLGVSSRGLGTANKARWEEEDCDLVDHFVLRAIDVVADPSAKNAMVDAIQEEKQYILDDSTGEVMELNEESYRHFEKQLSSLPVKTEDKNEKVFFAIKKFLNSLRSNTK